MKSKAKALLEYIPFIGNYVNERVFNYRVERESKGITIEYSDLHKIIDDVFPKIKNFRRMDKQYQTINAKEVLRLLVNTNLLRDKYVADSHDCDDYAFAMKGFFSQKGLSNSTFGIMISKTHAYNFFIDDDKQLWIIEPQTATIFLAKDYFKQQNEDYKSIEFIL